MGGNADSDRFERAEELFHAALELPIGDRAAFLRDRCAGDDALHQRVARLLSHADRDTTVMDMGAGAPEPVPGAERPGTLIDGYRIVEPIGEGGFGTVYLAEQLEPVRRQVALKVIKLGMDTRQVIARFESERHALARMEHPGIARVLDAGALPSGRPYFVMDLVRGADITTYCKEHALAQPARLELLARVCDAVQHAHQKGVIHRDLKPSNVLVVNEDGRPAPRIIDFGIAMAMDDPGHGQTRQTIAGQLIGTPAYMSPEQATSSDLVDTRTDVYALGAILYELVTGTPPFGTTAFVSASQSEIERILREQEPERPSSRTSAARGDVEAIILTAMNKDPDRRYPSVSELAEDLRRHLRHQPVVARPPSWAYRAAKLIRRHRLAATSAAVILALLLGGGAAIVKSTLDARRAAAETAAVNAFMRDVLTSARPSRQGANVRLIDVMENASRDAMDHFTGYPELQALSRDLVGRVYESLGLHQKAVENLEPAYAALVEHYGPGDRRTLAAGHELAGTLLELHRLDEAESILPAVIDGHRTTFGADARETLGTEFILSSLLKERGRYDEAERLVRSIDDRTRGLPANDPLRENVQLALAELLHRRWQSGTESDALLEEALELVRPLIPPEGAPDENDFTSLSAMLRAASIFNEQGKSEEVVALARRAVDLAIPQFGENHGYTLGAMNALGNALHTRGEHQEAAEWVVRAIEGNRAELGERHPFLLGLMFDALPIFDAAGRDEQGEAYAREAVSRLESALGAHDPYVQGTRVAVAHFVSRRGRLDEADVIFEAVDRASRDDWTPRTRGLLAFFHGQHLARRGQREAAEAKLRDALRLLEEAGPAPTSQRGVWDAEAARTALTSL